MVAINRLALAIYTWQTLDRNAQLFSGVIATVWLPECDPDYVHGLGQFYELLQ